MAHTLSDVVWCEPELNADWATANISGGRLSRVQYEHATAVGILFAELRRRWSRACNGDISQLLR